MSPKRAISSSTSSIANNKLSPGDIVTVDESWRRVWTMKSEGREAGIFYPDNKFVQEQDGLSYVVLYVEKEGSECLMEEKRRDAGLNPCYFFVTGVATILIPFNEKEINYFGPLALIFQAGQRFRSQPALDALSSIQRAEEFIIQFEKAALRSRAAHMAAHKTGQRGRVERIADYALLNDASADDVDAIGTAIRQRLATMRAMPIGKFES